MDFCVFSNNFLNTLFYHKKNFILRSLYYEKFSTRCKFNT